MTNSDGAFGMEVVLDLHGCRPETIRSPDLLTGYVRQLCRLIDMKPYGDPFLARFGLNDPKATGYSLVQLIETSSITGHFSEQWNSGYLNIFSCKEFDAEVATRFTQEFFAASSVDQRILVRK